MEISRTPAWDDLRVLLAVHRHESLLGAGRALGVSTSTAARRIEALEAALGRRLVHRSSAGTHVEPDALELVRLAEQLELGLSAARRDEGGAALGGTVRISCGDGFVRPVTHVLAEVRRSHPQLVFELIAESRMVDLSRREADIGIRNVRSSAPALIERKVGMIGFALYASHAYVERRLRTPRLAADDFARHDFVGYEGALTSSPQMTWLRERGAVRFPLRTSSDLAFQDATEEGMGIGLLAEVLGAALPRLVRLDVDGAPPSVPVYLAFHRDLRRVPRVRVVLNALEAALRRVLD